MWSSSVAEAFGSVSLLSPKLQLRPGNVATLPNIGPTGQEVQTVELFAFIILPICWTYFSNIALLLDLSG